MAKQSKSSKGNDKKSAPKKNPTVEKVVNDFNSSWDYTSGSWHDRWNDNYKLYNNERVNPSYNGITNTFVPMTFSTIESMTSALFGSKPSFDYVPPQDKAEQQTDILNSLVDYYWDKDKWSMKVINWGRDMLRYGTSIVYLSWDSNCPRMINVPIRDFFIDPSCTTLENARFMGRRYLVSLEELKSYEIVDLEKSTDEDTVYKKKYKNLGKIKKSGGGSPAVEKTDKEEKDMFYGSTISSNDDLLEVIEYWTDNNVTSIANRNTLIEESENIYKTKDRDNGTENPKGMCPFAVLRNYVDGSLFYAKGEIDFIAQQQELLNDLTNQNIDAVTFTLNPMYTLDPLFSDMIEQIENLPGAVYPLPAGALNPIQMGNVPQDAFNERLNIKDEMRETSASNEIVKGAGQQGGSITATEVQAQIAGAGQRIALKVTQIEDEGFHRLAVIVFKLIRLYVTEKQMVRVAGRAGTEYKEYDPEEFKEGEYEPRIQLETTINAKKAEDANMAKEMLGAFLGDPEINQKKLKETVLLKGFDLDPDDVQALMTPEELPEEELAGELPINPMQDPMADPAMQGMEQPIEEQQPQQPIYVEDPETGEIFIQDPVTGELISAETPQEQQLV
jgi:hypothetical protein